MKHELWTVIDIQMRNNALMALRCQGIVLTTEIANLFRIPRVRCEAYVTG
jgi:hypothetical protein